MAKAKKTMKKQDDVKADTVERGDLLVLQVAAKSLENTELKLQLAQVNLERLQQERQQLVDQMRRLTLQANEKYNLVSGSDKLDINSGEITRG